MAESLPTTMRAVEISEPGGPSVLVPVEVPVPAPGEGEVLIKTAGIGVNRPDVLQRRGGYPPPAGASPLPGLEVSGTIVAQGPGVSGPAIGSQVCALLAGGGYAEYAVAASPLCLPIPAGIDLVHAAGLPETYFTVWTNLFDSGHLQAGESVLVHGGSSGIGTTAIQVAKSIGATVYVTAGNAEKCSFCRELGADLAIDYSDTDFVEAVLQATNGNGVDLVLDMVGGDYVQRNFDCLGLEGRYVSIAFLQGATVTVNLQKAMVKRQSWTGTTLRPRTIAQKATIADQVRQHIWPKLEEGTIKPIIHQTLPLAQASDAHALMESSRHIGKILLVP